MAGVAPPRARSRSPQRIAEDGGSVLDVDASIDRLVRLKRRPPAGQNIWLPLETIELICERALHIFAEQDVLLELEAPLNLCGDIHGQFHDLLRLFDHGGYPPASNYLFLGDYVDRGKRSLETVLLLFLYKIKYPENFFLLRGNHETPRISRQYGFYDECKQRYNVRLWKRFCDVFNWLPICAVIDDRVICMHGGLSPHMLEPDKGVRDMIREIPRPTDIPDQGLLCDLLWSDPKEDLAGFDVNTVRGVSVTFGDDIVRQVLLKEDWDLVVRAHECVADGYLFFAERKLVTVFSAPNYIGGWDNSAAMLCLDDQLACSLQVLKPDISDAVQV